MDGTGAKEERSESVEPGALDLAAIVELTGSSALIDLLRGKLGFPQAVFDQSVMPVIDRCAQRAQLQPADGSLRYDRPGGKFIRALEVGSRALDYRRGQILPRGAAPEEIGAHAHRWSYAVLAAAMIRGMGGATDTDTGATTNSLPTDWIPDWVEDWLSQDPRIGSSLKCFLVDVHDSGAIAELVRQAMHDCGMLSPAALAAGDVVTPVSFPAGVAGSSEPLTRSDQAQAPVTPDVEKEFLEDDVGTAHDASAALPASTHHPSPEMEVPRRFMDWIRRGLHDGRLEVNEAGAMVHFVEDGMLLVSPRVFQAFSKRYVALLKGLIATESESDLSRSVQRLVMRKGWHVRSDDGVNVVTYVLRGERRSSRISGVLFQEPERFIGVIPGRNTRLVRVAARPSGR